MRYITLVLLNIPIIILAFTSLLTKYKTHRISRGRFVKQIALWAAILTVLVLSFPIYNYLSGNPPLASAELSFFDIVQTTAIIWLVYVIYSQRQKQEYTERRLRDLHQELSITLSDTTRR